jgi:ATP/maltotriose-dependent transcriptional regulator MalT
MIAGWCSRPPVIIILAMLSKRERDVLRLLAKGCTYKQVAERLAVSAHTVATHVKNSYRKLGVRSATAAVARARQLKLL